MNYFLQLNKLTLEQQVQFYQRFKEKHISAKAVLWLCLIGGYIGVHKFYLKQYVVGFLYLLFSWTMIPFVLSIINLFTMYKEIDNINNLEAYKIINQIIKEESLL